MDFESFNVSRSQNPTERLSFNSSRKWTNEPSRTFKLDPIDLNEIKKDLERDKEETFNKVNVERTSATITEETFKLQASEVTKPEISVIEPTLPKASLNIIPEETLLSCGVNLLERESDAPIAITGPTTVPKKNDSFDLDFSALSLHTPIKSRDKPLTNITPRINIIRCNDADKLKTPQVNCILSNPSLIRNKHMSLFKTPQNSCRKVIPYTNSSKKATTPAYPYVNMPTPMHTKYERYCVPSELSCIDEKFERIKVKESEYIVLNMLGRGGSSEVFHCFNVKTKAHVAIKCVSLKNPISAEGYKKEVILLEELQKCDKIVKMFEYEILEAEEMLVVVLEKAGEDLSSILKQLSKRQSHVPVYMLLFYWLEMLYAVQQIHENGVIHADLKPANFLRADSGLKLIDFGIASRVQDDMTSVYKATQEGSCNYISPEALTFETGSNPNSPSYGNPKCQLHFKSDVWSLGCILYQLIYRRTPFQHLNQLWTKLAAIMNPNHQIDYPSADWVPSKFIDTLKRCLQYNVKLRPSVKELILEYEEMLGNLS